MLRLLFSLIVLLAAYPAQAADAPAAPASTLDKVKAAKTMRCGYLPWEPYIKKDINTGAMSGITYDYLNGVAKANGITIEWSTEVAIDQIVPALQGGKMDMFCLPCSPVPEWEERLDFVGSFGSLPYFVYGSAEQPLDDGALKYARFAVIDGFIPSHETPLLYPRAKITTLPQTTSTAELFDQIRYGKTDAVINEHLSAEIYLKNNPGIIRKLKEEPVVIKPMSFVVKNQDPQWSDYVTKTFSTSKPENKAYLERLMKKYNLTEDLLFLNR